MLRLTSAGNSLNIAGQNLLITPRHLPSCYKSSLLSSSVVLITPRHLVFLHLDQLIHPASCSNMTMMEFHDAFEFLWIVGKYLLVEMHHDQRSVRKGSN